MLRFAFELETIGVEDRIIREALAEILHPIKVGYKKRAKTEDSRNSDQYGIIDPSDVLMWHAHWEMALETDEPTCEIKSRINPTDTEIYRAVTKLKELGCRTNAYCGMHVHVSDTELPVRSRLPPVEIWPERIPEVRPKGITGWHRRAKGVAQINDKHVEIRVFNAMVDPDYVISNIQLALASIHFPTDTEPLSNAWQSVPIVKARPNFWTT